MSVSDTTKQGASQTAVRKERSLYQESMIRLLRNKVAIVSLSFIVILTISTFFLAPYITKGDYAAQTLSANNAVPEWLMFLMPEGAENYVKIDNSYTFGADALGRDLWTRAIFGARISLQVAFIGSTVALIIGTIYGLVSGYAGGWVDNLMMRVVDFLYAFPFLIVVILMQSFFKAQARAGGNGEASIWNWILGVNEKMGGLFLLFIAIGLINWLGMARIARGQVLSLKKKEFIEAAHALGSGSWRIITKHLLPNILGPLIVAETMAIPGYIFTEAFLSFIGLGVDPPTPSWGIMISEAIPALRTYPNQLLVPAVFLSLTTLAFNFLGDGIRDAFDPKQA